MSQSTVNRVLNNTKSGRFCCSAKMGARILTVANVLTYRPSVAARNLAVARTKLVAVVGLREIWSGPDWPHQTRGAGARWPGR